MAGYIYAHQVYLGRQPFQWKRLENFWLPFKRLPAWRALTALRELDVRLSRGKSGTDELVKARGWFALVKQEKAYFQDGFELGVSETDLWEAAQGFMSRIEAHFSAQEGKAAAEVAKQIAAGVKLSKDLQELLENLSRGEKTPSTLQAMKLLKNETDRKVKSVFGENGKEERKRARDLASFQELEKSAREINRQISQLLEVGIQKVEERNRFKSEINSKMNSLRDIDRRLEGESFSRAKGFYLGARHDLELLNDYRQRLADLGDRELTVEKATEIFLSIQGKMRLKEAAIVEVDSKINMSWSRLIELSQASIAHEEILRHLPNHKSLSSWTSVLRQVIQDRQLFSMEERQLFRAMVTYLGDEFTIRSLWALVESKEVDIRKPENQLSVPERFYLALEKAIRATGASSEVTDPVLQVPVQKAKHPQILTMGGKTRQQWEAYKADPTQEAFVKKCLEQFGKLSEDPENGSLHSKVLNFRGRAIRQSDVERNGGRIYWIQDRMAKHTIRIVYLTHQHPDESEYSRFNYDLEGETRSLTESGDHGVLPGQGSGDLEDAGAGVGPVPEEGVPLLRRRGEGRE